MSKNTINFIVLLGIIMLVSLGRLWVHPFNFTPVIAIILFSIYFFESPILKFIIPISVLFFSDLVLEYTKGIGFYEGAGIVYFSYFAILFFAYFFLKKITVLNLAIVSIFSSTIFFLISNFAFFYPESFPSNPTIGTYSHDFSGIVSSYLAGIPFYKNMLLGDLFYSFILFGIAFSIQKFLRISAVFTSN